MSDQPTNSQLLIYRSEDGRIKLDVRFDGETVWLTQPMIADLFETTVPNVSMHLRNIFAEGELTPEATVKNFLTVRQEGTRQVSRSLEYLIRLTEPRDSGNYVATAVRPPARAASSRRCIVR